MGTYYPDKQNPTYCISVLYKTLVSSASVSCRTVRGRLQKSGLRGCVAAKKSLRTDTHKNKNPTLLHFNQGFSLSEAIPTLTTINIYATLSLGIQ